jgi:ABC-type sugar transport system ATPase subunit
VVLAGAPARSTDAGGSRGAIAVSVGGLRKAYGATVAVDGITFAVARGEGFGLPGL